MRGERPKNGGGIANADSCTLEITGSATFDGNYAKTTASSKEAVGGAIYNGGPLKMTAGSIGTTTKNYVQSTNGSIYGGAIGQRGTFEASGGINFYNSGNANGQNDVYLPGGRSVKVIGLFTNTSSKVMTITPGAYSIGTSVATRDATNCTVAAFKTSVGKMGLVKSGLCDTVDWVENGGSEGSSSYEIKGVVGIELTSLKVSDLTTYMGTRAWIQYGSATEIPDGLNCFILKHTGGKYAMLKLKKNNAGSNGKISAEYVVFSSSSDTSTHSSQSLSMANYSSSGSGFSFVADWNIFGPSRTPTPVIDENHVSITDNGGLVFFIASDTHNGIQGFKVP